VEKCAVLAELEEETEKKEEKTGEGKKKIVDPRP